MVEIVERRSRRMPAFSSERSHCCQGLRGGFGAIGVIMVSLAMVGCSEERGVPLVEVEGAVKIDGQPAENILITFCPDLTSGKFCPTSTGISDATGKFSLRTMGGQKGAVAGTCKVTLVDLNEDRPDRSAEGREAPGSDVVVRRPKRLPAKYSMLGPGGLSAEVTKDGAPIVIDVRG